MNFNENIIVDEIFNNENRKNEMIRILLQTLENMGYDKTAQQLIEETGIKCESEELIKFRQSILLGQWKKSLDILQQLNLNQDEYKNARYLINEQKYLEMLEIGDLQCALDVLRNQLSHYCEDKNKLYMMANLAIFTNIDDIKKKSGWLGTNFNSRKKLISMIQKECSSLNMLESNKMEKIVLQAIGYQVQTCRFHYQLDENFSLIKEHQCPYQEMASEYISTLRSHKDEVWVVKFSPNGKYLASISKSCSLIIWSFNYETLNTKLLTKIIQCHSSDIQCMSWSSDDAMVATGSSDCKIKIWNILSGQEVICLQGHSEKVCAVIWHPKNKEILFSAGIDNYIQIWNINGQKLGQIKSQRLLDLLITSDGKKLIAVSASTSQIRIIDVLTKQDLHTLEVKDVINSVAVSYDDAFLLINTSYTTPVITNNLQIQIFFKQIQLWSLLKYQMINSFDGHKQEKFMLRCSFGGFYDQAICCGSEDGSILIWHRNIAQPQKVLKSHSQTVNCISFNPIVPNIMVSASDDHTIKIWVSQSILEKLQKFSNYSNDISQDKISEQANNSANNLNDEQMEQEFDDEYEDPHNEDMEEEEDEIAENSSADNQNYDQN